MAKDPEQKDPLLDDEEETTDEVASDEADEDQVAPKAEKPRRTTTRATAPAAAQTSVEEGANSNVQRALLSDAEATKRALAKAPKVWFMVPLSPFEKEGAYEEVYINGYRTTIKKGVMVEIPQPVMEILANKYKVETEVGREMRIDRDDRTQDALTA